jgi:two-component system response regulator
LEMSEDDEILLIEDDEDKAEILISLLKQHLPAKIRHIVDGENAMNYLLSYESRNTKLILLDLILPRLDGVEILRRIKADPIRSSIPVIILSSSSKTQDYVEALGLHPDGYAQKPGRLKNCA